MVSSPGPSACECVDGWYISGTNPLVCSQCNDDCTTCNGGSSSDCLSCSASNSELVSSPGPSSCQCVDGWYASGTGPLVCSQCDNDCATCDESTSSDCLSCEEANSELISSPGPSACKCVDGWYASGTNPLECSQCNDDCATCDDSSSSDCLTCDPSDSSLSGTAPNSC